MVSEDIDITVAVCTYNRADRLVLALQSLQQIQRPTGMGVELLVVDNASTDDTAKVVQRMAKDSPVPMRLVHESQQGVAHARNRALSSAPGRWVAFFDDDQLADERWLVELLAASNRRKCRCVGGAVRLRLPDDRPLAQACRILLSETPADMPESQYQGPRTPGAGNLLVDRRMALAAGGFDAQATMGGEDTALYRALKAVGEPVWFTPLAIIEHVVPAERLQGAYLLWNARRTGAHIADIERHHFGRFGFAGWWLARIAQALCKAPRIGWRLRRGNDPVDRTGARCLAAAAGGYWRRSLHLLSGGWVSADRYFQQLDFRSEREQFGS